MYRATFPVLVYEMENKESLLVEALHTQYVSGSGGQRYGTRLGKMLLE